MRFLLLSTASAFCFGFAGLVSFQASAQSVAPAQEPGRIQDNLGSLRDLRPEAPSRPNRIDAQTAPEVAAGIEFIWQDLNIDGAKAFTKEDLMSSWKYSRGDKVSVADIFAFANAITEFYAAKGYALSFGVVPEQDIAGGVFTIRVVEGFVEKIDYSGEELPKGVFGRSSSPVAALAERILQSRPLRSADLERYLLLINDLSGMTAKATLSPSPDVVGGSVLTLNVERKRFSGEVGYNSFLPQSLDRHVAGGSLEFNDLITGADRLRIGGWHSITGNAYYSGNLDYKTYIGSDGFSLNFSAFYSQSRPVSAALRNIRYQGKSFNAYLGGSYPLIRSRGRNLHVDFGLSVMEANSDYFAARLMQDRLRTADLALTYDFTDANLAANSIRLGLSQGLNIMGAEGSSRAFGKTDYTIATLTAQRLQPVGSLGGGMVSVLGSAFAQAALNGPLYSAAECSYGGRRFGRSLDSGDLNGEHCLLGGFELRWERPFDVAGQRIGFQGYGFVDGGVLQQAGALVPGERRHVSAMSGGVGMRFNFGHGVSSGAELSRTFVRPSGMTVGDDWRVTGFFSVGF